MFPEHLTCLTPRKFHGNRIYNLSASVEKHRSFEVIDKNLQIFFKEKKCGVNIMMYDESRKNVMIYKFEIRCENRKRIYEYSYKNL
jgi:hypothetical protein